MVELVGEPLHLPPLAMEGIRSVEEAYRGVII